MADMRLIVAGAGGRMGRALTRVISETPGAVVAGALEAPGSELLGKDAGVLAGLPANGVKLSADLWTLSANADGILDFTVPAATIANVAIAAERGLVHVIGTTGLSASDMAVIKSVTIARDRGAVRQYEPRRQSAGRAGQARRASLDESFDIEILEMHHKCQDRRAVGHRVDARRGGGRRPRASSWMRIRRAAATAYRRAAARRYRLCVACAAAPSAGDHSVIFAGPFGAHRRCRTTPRTARMFAQGAVKAALWAHGKKPGFYTMTDVLGP